MKDINNIDELLRQSFEGFSPQPPANAWQGIQQGIANQPLAQPGVENAAVKSGNILAKIKGLTIASKVVTTAVIVAVTAGIVYLVEPTIEEKPKEVVALVEPTFDNAVKNEVKEEETVSKPTDKVLETANISKNVTKPTTKKIELKLQNDVQEPLVQEKQNEITENKTEEITEKKIELKNEPITERKQFNLTPPPTKRETGFNKTVEKPEVYNSITPNNDGKNDFLEVVIKNETFYNLIILNSNGKTVFESESVDNKWNGKVNNVGADCEVGTYNYVLKYMYKGDKEARIIYGQIQLLL